MKWCLVLFLLQNNVVSAQKNDSLLLVEKWWIVNYGSKLGEKQTFIKKTFDGQKLVSKIEYSKGGTNLIDSTSFEFSNSNPDIKNNIDKSESNQKNSLLDILCRKDSLGLLRDELAEIEFVMEKGKQESGIKAKSLVRKYQFKAGFRPIILTQYGITFDALLEKMSIYVKDDRLIKDEFHFSNVNLTREYMYLNDRISEIKIIVKYKDGIIDNYHEGFTYKWIIK